ncbi:hypothetical protein M422DRAFT_276525 [Sphaerobolus stellatus SS14]|uniref:Uncharacterized protein n=1 Tax=Sphaerobolus stellatus (strain SS14) TaxID=990650 RepID=A0A0C9UD38_SPHS4|nr:hypothetical protein M422DRAFT_276525 [Sphaerobolus stellatus SS14]
MDTNLRQKTKLLVHEYPNPTSLLKANYNKNLDIFFSSVKLQHNYTQLYLYGK